MVLDYPNKEVRQSMYQFLIDDLAYNPRRTHTGMTILDLQKALIANDLTNVRAILDGLLGDLPAETYQHSSEGLYHGLIHLIFSYLGMSAQSEVHSAKGRADAVVQTLTHIYIFEFKFNKTAQEGLDQIQNQGYARKYRTIQKIIIGIGVNFNKTERAIDDWKEQII
jgi:PD-(D/E)XK nuclease superfamily